jgi:hypothetical protein
MRQELLGAKGIGKKKSLSPTARAHIHTTHAKTHTNTHINKKCLSSRET